MPRISYAAATPPTIPFGTIRLNDGNEIPAIAFGSGSVFREKDATVYVAQALESGFSHIDTAQVYKNEEGVGVAIRESGLQRSELFITTKYGLGNIRETIRSSLTKLGLKYVDLYLIHSPEFIRKDFEGSWIEFEKIKERGLARSIGVSNFTVDDLQKLMKIAKITPAVNQIRFHPYNYVENIPILEYAAKHDIVIEGYNSLYPLTGAPGGPVDAPVIAAAKKRGATMAQILLAWVRAKGVVIVTTSSRKEHLKDYLAVADLLPLTKDEITAIDEAGAR